MSLIIAIFVKTVGQIEVKIIMMFTNYQNQQRKNYKRIIGKILKIGKNDKAGEMRQKQKKEKTT